MEVINSHRFNENAQIGTRHLCLLFMGLKTKIKVINPHWLNENAQDETWESLLVVYGDETLVYFDLFVSD
ncbi:hypothetical protein ElyMa_002475600 [Elysia marginata]|uniref:Uncharacterized protein n=1 Tax=Elysia marginata TaxID=1093978 RepID=A0AAV4GMR8_9GAST|nr:hypothetical protein ElyMa_002475600 [Elysia marginata]